MHPLTEFLSKYIKARPDQWDCYDKDVRTWLSEVKYEITKSYGISWGSNIKGTRNLGQILGLSEPTQECKHEWIKCYEDSIPFCRHCTVRKPLEDSPKKDEVKWCEHMKPGSLWYFDSPKKPWFDQWMYCPKCGTPRPQLKSLRQKFKAIFEKNQGKFPSANLWRKAMLDELAECSEQHFQESK